MKALLADLAALLAALPANLRAGLRPGVRADDTPSQRLRRNFIYHLHPLKVTERALAPATTFGLGLLAGTLLLLLLGTGLLLMIYYDPTPAGAYASVLDLEHQVAFGRLCRSLHRFAGHAFVLVLGLHLLRVLLTAAYRGRELNWTIGVGLFVLGLGLAFSGYLLPWDQTSFWAVRVVTNMLDHLPGLGAFIKRLLLGGEEVGGAALLRFYALHVALLPVPMLGLVALHLWRIRRDGGLARDARREWPMVPAWPHLVLREGTLMLVALALLLVVATVVAAPLGPVADALRPDNPEKAPWYFIGVQEMVSHSALVGGAFFPGLLLAGLVLLPYFDREPDGVGSYLGASGERWRTLAWLTAALLVVIAATAWTVAEASALAARLSPWQLEWVNPTGALLLVTLLVGGIIGARTGKVGAAWRMALLVLLVGLVWFTALGLLRGPDWQLFWPWEEWPRAF